MFVLRLLGKVLLIPVWLLVAAAWIFVKIMVSIYSFARGFAVFGLGALIVGTLICYHDWKQVLFLMCLYGVTFVVLFAGVFFEEGLEAIDIRHLADQILDTCGGICALFSGNDEIGYKYALGERDGDVRELLKEMNSQLQGRGGGKPFFAQGSLQGEKKRIIEFFIQKGFMLIG